MKQTELHFFSIRTVAGDDKIPRFKKSFNIWLTLQFFSACLIPVLLKAQPYAGMDLHAFLVLANLVSMIGLVMAAYYAIRWLFAWLFAPKDKIEIVG